ncbi:MAG: dihydrolipoyllysine-residue acetyltransferase [Legionellaceae bacterium]|nr:dihydrolipoyllysine-residue acetyltransferase [Legionellaceae bacterium]
MADQKTVTVPDIGGAENVDVIEVMVKEGDIIAQDDSLITLESDKASMEIPSSASGKVLKVLVKVGDKLSEGAPIIELASAEDVSAADHDAGPADSADTVEQETRAEEKAAQPPSDSTPIDICIPDIGGSEQVDVIDILVREGDRITAEQPLLTLESDKATMDIPAPQAGKIAKLLLKVGDKVSQGSRVLTLIPLEAPVAKKDERQAVSASPVSQVQPSSLAPSAEKSQTRPAQPATSDAQNIYAGPGVRRMAHELGVDLHKVTGSGRKNRISKEDVRAYIKQKLSQPESTSSAFTFPNAPTIDFSRFGAIEEKTLSKIKRLTGENVHRSWLSIPQVTQFDEADITELEAFRKQEQAKREGYKLTLLAFVTKAVAQALKAYPQFNSSLDSHNHQLIYKKYVNIGIAVDTPNGLVVPVIKGVDNLSVADIAKEMGRLSSKARDKGLMPTDMNGGCFTISSLGGIGGTAFTPIVNSPEVAILGLSRSQMKPVWQGDSFVPRLMLPMSLSYDHRVIDGAEAAHFSRYLAELLTDIRRVLL